MAFLKTTTLLVVILASAAVNASPIDFTDDEGNELKLSYSKAAFGKRLPSDKMIYNDHIHEGVGGQGYYTTNRIYSAPKGHVINYVKFWGDSGKAETVSEAGYGIGGNKFWLLFRNTIISSIDMHVEVYAIEKSE